MKQNFHRTKFILAALLVLETAIPTVSVAKPANEESRFEQLYNRWIVECRDPRVMATSNSTIYLLPAFKEITAMGFPALPEIIEKLPRNPMLTQAVFAITKTRVPREIAMEMEDHHKRVAYVKTWWVNADHDAAIRFTKHAAKFRNAKHSAQNQEMTDELKSIQAIGRTALPHLFTSIANGEVEMIPIASALMDGAFPPTATPEECAAWWQANKQKWTLPALR